MKRMPSAKEIVRFALVATPAIWLTLFVIQQSMEPMPVFTYNPAPIPAFTTDCIGCGDEAVIDALLPVAEGFKSKATITKVEDATIRRAAGITKYPRQIITVSLPYNLGPDEVDANLREVARHAFEDGVLNVVVVACRPVHPGYSSLLPVATLTFAPYGDFDKTDRVYSINNYRAAIEHNDIAAPVPVDFEECER